MTAQPAQQIDVDELAKEKVQEIETLLDSNNNTRLEGIKTWFSVLKQIITAADLHRTNDKNDTTESAKVDESIYADYADDNERFSSVDLGEQFATNSVKWTIRVKAFKLVHRLVQMPNTSKTMVLKHLPDLIRLSFVAATSPYDDLKTQGFEMFKFLINRFASVEEKEFPGHSILEQYRTQVLSALKPAFHLDAPPYITAIASQVCCSWISRGLERDPANLRRAYQLMIVTIEKLENQSINQNSKLYTESELEQERLDILGSWAHLYITARESIGSSSEDSHWHNELLKLVLPQISSLIDKWWEALKDYALLIMPAPKHIGSMHDNEHVYTRDVALRLFAPVWYKLILATTCWLCLDDSKQIPLTHDEEKKACDTSNQILSSINRTRYFNFICGILMKEFCRCHSEDLAQKEYLSESTLFTLRSLSFLVNNEELQSFFHKDKAILQEFYTILYSISINSLKLKSQHQSILKHSLERIFMLAIKQFSENQTNLKFAISNDAKAIQQDLLNLEQSIKNEEKSTSEKLKLNLAIVINRVICILKSTPELVATESDLLEAIISISRKCISFNTDLSIGMVLLEQSKDLYSYLPPEIYQVFALELLKAQVAVVTDLISSTSSNKERQQSDSHLETYLRHSRIIIDKSAEEHKKVLLSTYLEAVLKGLFEMINSKPATQEKCIQSISSLVIKHIKDLSKDNPEAYEEVMQPDLKELLSSVLMHNQSNNTTENVEKGNRVTDKPAKAAKKTEASKSAAKITLRADFSNFYTKKA